MSRQCYVTATLVNLFSLILLFPEVELFSQRQEICFSNAKFKYCFQLTSILFWLEKTRLEIQNLITIILSWPAWIIPNVKQPSF